MPSNPWGLTDRESETMDAICETGCQKLAAIKLGRTKKTVENHAARAKEKMKARTTLLKYLTWDRWRRK